MTMTQTSDMPLFPAVTGRLVPTILLAGIAADLTWEVWARGITPFLVGGPLEPAALVQSVFGFQSWAAGELIHAITGIVFYPIGYLFIARPLQRRIVPQLPLALTRHRLRHRAVDLRPLRHGASDRRAARLPRLHPADLGLAGGPHPVRPGRRLRRTLPRVPTR
ncbi:hypothetical protein QFZ27_001967 [Inquilinus ginsengisoli]|uniref:hypothetical protein n=1 Tax=Inquilinus ginsengisoli TaxID=363840 RepID=UPI003D23B29D